jgi:hypothetical protein
MRKSLRFHALLRARSSSFKRAAKGTATVVGLSAKQSPPLSDGADGSVFLLFRPGFAAAERADATYSAWSDPATRARRVDHAEADFR